MKQSQFTERHEPEWLEIESYLDARNRRNVDRPFSPAEFPRRYRRLCQHLSLARSRGYSHGLHQRLEHLVTRAHEQLYQGRRGSLASVVRFVLVDYPALVRREWRYLLAAALMFMGPVLILIPAISIVPEVAFTVLSVEDAASMEEMYSPDLRSRYGREREAETDVFMFGFYVRNNTSIGFQTFVGGALFGLGTVFFLLFNGLHIGATAGHLTHLGYIDTFWGFVSGHSAFELTAIMLSGAAGLRVGMALLAPGAQTRRLAFRDAMQVGVRLMAGAAVLFLAAAFVEAFWSSRAEVPVMVKYVVGVLLWLVTFAYLMLPGREES